MNLADAPTYLTYERLVAELGRPRRQVAEHPAGWTITASEFVTTDKTLASAVAAELDRIDPLPGRMWRVGENGPE